MDNTLVNNGQQQSQQAFNGINPLPSPSSVTPMSNMSSLLAQGQAALTPQAPVAAPVAAKSPGLFQRLLPTIGSIALPTLADIFTGGLAAPLDVALAGIGGGAGKAAENLTSGQGLGLKSDLENAAIGGLGNAGGQLIEGGLNGLSGAAENAAQTAADTAANQAGDATTSKIYSAIPKGLRNAFDLNGSLDLAGTVGADASDPQNLVDASKQAIDALNTPFNDALGQAGPVDNSGYTDMVKNAVEGRSNVLGSSDPVMTSRGHLGMPNNAAGKLLDQLNGYGTGVVSSEADRTQVRQLLQQVGSAAADAKPGVTAMTGAVDPVQKASYDALNEVYNGLKSVLYGGPEVTDAVNGMEGNFTAADVGGNQALADHLNEVIESASEPQDILDELQKLGNMGKIGNAGVSASQGLVGTAAPEAEAGGLSGLMKNPAVKLGLAVAGGAEEKKTHGLSLLAALPELADLGSNPTVLGGASKALGVLGGAGRGIIPELASQTVANSPNDVAGAAGAGQQIGNQGAALNPQNTLVDQALQEAMNNPLNGGLSQIGTLLPLAQKANAAEQAVQGLIPSYNAAGGAQGPLGGLLSKLGSVFTGGPAGQYGAQAAQAAPIIDQALGIPAGSSPALPQITQNQTSAQQALTNIQNLIQALQIPANSNGSLMGALGK